MGSTLYSSGAGSGRNSEEKCTSFSNFALRPDAAAVSFHYSSGDVKTKPRSQAALRLSLPELLEYVGKMVGGDSRAGVLHPEKHVVPSRLRPEGDGIGR